MACGRVGAGRTLIRHEAIAPSRRTTEEIVGSAILGNFILTWLFGEARYGSIV